jgi:putative transposase
MMLDRVAEQRGYPDMLVVDNGPELRGRDLDRWAHDHGVKLFFIDPGKPMQNGSIESFMYGRPPRCKEEDSFGRRSGAFMYTACSCGRVHGRWP